MITAITGTMIQTAFLVIAILVVQKALGNKLHAYVRYGLWLLVVLRLMIPVNFVDSRLSMLQIVETIRLSNAVRSNIDWQKVDLQGTDNEELTNALNGQEASLKNVLQSTNAGIDTENISPIESTENTRADAIKTEISDSRQSDNTLSTVTKVYESGTINKILLAIWLTGSLLVGGFLAFSYFVFWRRLYKLRVVYKKDLFTTINETHVPVYRVKGLETPCLMGLVHPAIYIGTDIDMTTDYFRYIITHEKVHYLHRDHIWVFVRAVLVIVYWFHPFVWIAAALSARDGEIACDYGTVRQIGKEERFAYGEMLLSLSKIQRGRRVYSYGTMLRPGKSELKRRIMQLTQTNGSRVWAGILAILLMVIAAGCAFTGASETDGDKEILPVNEAGIDSTDAAVNDNGNIVTDSGNVQDENKESDGGENSPDNDDTYNMEPRQLEAEPAEISGETPFGADGPWLDYAGGMGTDKGSRIIFHDYFGLIVYDLDRREIARSLELASIGCDKTQGDDACQVAVSEDGATVWLHPMSKRYMYRYEVEDNLLYQEPLVKTFELDLENKELFDRYSTSEEESSYWHSNYLYEEYKDAEGLHETYIYLYVFNTQDGSDSELVLRNLECAWDDMMFTLFKGITEIQGDTKSLEGAQDNDGFPYNYDGNVEYVEMKYGKPCNYTRISGAFGGRAHPTTGEVTVHDGIDFVAAEGTDITAAADGVVYETGFSAKHGNYAVLRHANGDMTYYCHCKEVIVKKDDQVKRGDKIATVGQTGQATGSFLHFALSKDGAFVNPQNYMEDT